MTTQPNLVRMRGVLLAAARAAPTQPAAGVEGSKADLILGPVTPTGVPTQGFTCMLVPGPNAAVADTGGFDVTFWLRDPGTGFLGAGDTIAMAYNEAFITGDVDACELYVEIANVDSDGDLILLYCEV